MGALPVCEDDRLLGMVTDRDIVLRAVADGRPVESAVVRDVMSSGVIHVFADQEVEVASQLMAEKQIRRVPVLNRAKRLVGILALGDIAVRSQPAFSGLALREVSESAEEHMSGGHSDAFIPRQAIPRGIRNSRGGGNTRAQATATRRRSTGNRSRQRRSALVRSQTRGGGGREGTRSTARPSRRAGSSARSPRPRRKSGRRVGR